MDLLAHSFTPSGSTHGRPPYSNLLSLGDVVPTVPNLVNSPRVLRKRALILVNQIFLLLAKLSSALSDIKSLVSAT
jgi:hypothetical protein